MACIPGDEKCIGPDLYVCREHYDPRTGEYVADWVLKERNAPQCKVAPPPPPLPPPPPPEPEPPPIVALDWIGSIFSFVWDIADWFLSAYQEVSGWIWPFHYLQYPLYGIHRVCRDLLTPIAHFWFWAEHIATKLQAAWTSEGILGLIKWWFPWLYDVGEWFYGRWNWFLSAAGDWWSSTKVTVLGWIDIATQGLNTLRVLWDEFWTITWPKWTATLEVLGSEVSSFFTKTLPDLVDNLKLEHWWKGKLFAVDGLIGSKLAEWFPFYDDVAEFFKDPGEFLLSRLTDWFLGKEE